MDASRRSPMVAARELERSVPWMRPFLQTADLYLMCRPEAIPLRTIPGRVVSINRQERRGDRSDLPTASGEIYRLHCTCQQLALDDQTHNVNAISREPRFRRIDRSSRLGTYLVKAQSERLTVLAGIKLVHTAIWLFFAGCIVAIPIAGARRQFLLAAVLTGLVLLECAVLAVNRCRCPLTSLAGRYTQERADNFDIYLPLWLARRNKTILGTPFAVGESGGGPENMCQR